MNELSRNDYIALVEQDYFDNVALGNLDEVLDCFTDDCLVSIRHGDNPPRLFRKKPRSEKESRLAGFYQHLCGNFDAWFGDFSHYIDTDKEKCACTFTVKLTPKTSSPYLEAGTQTLKNCNFFCYDGGKISAMTIYYSNSDKNTAEEQAPGRPTGYPRN